MPEVIRAIELPLQHLDGDWGILRECWRNGTMLANWCVTKLLQHDVTRAADMVRLPKYPGIPDSRYSPGYMLKGLYGVAVCAFRMQEKDSWWKGAAQSVSSICRKVSQKYMQNRLAVLWMCKERLERFNYPYPWPVNGQSWREADYDPSGRPRIRLAMPGGNLCLTLRSGQEFGRQLSIFRQIVNGSHPRLEVSIRQQPASLGCHRPTVIEKTPGGGQDRPQRVMVKMVACVPVREKEGNEVVTLCTDPHAFWVAEIAGRRAWAENADHIRRAFAWLAVHETQQQRWAQDCKAERRANKRHLLQFEESRKRCCLKHRRRMKSWMQETVAHFVRFAVRQKVATVAYMDMERGFIPSFPWAAIKWLLRSSLEMEGIDLVEREEVYAGATGGDSLTEGE